MQVTELSAEGLKRQFKIVVPAGDLSAKVDKLNEESQKMGAALYAKAAEQGESADVPGSEQSDRTEQGESDDDVVDAEVVEDDEDEAKK
jgi:molecular chaperone DnaK